jgi:hypothetical protein
VWKIKPLYEEIKDDRSARKMDRGKHRKVENTTVGFFGAPREKEGKAS